MIGLLLESYYKNIKNICIMNLFLVGVWIFINIFTNSQTIIFLYLAVVVCSNSFLLLLSQKKDYDLELYKYEFILPIKKKNIVLSKYLSQIIIIIFSVLMLIVLNYLSFTIGKNYYDYGLVDFISLLNILTAFIIQMVGLFYLCSYFLDLTKGDLWIGISLIGSIILVGVEVFVVNRLGFSKICGNIIFCIIYSILFVMSYVLNGSKFEKLRLKF